MGAASNGGAMYRNNSAALRRAGYGRFLRIRASALVTLIASAGLACAARADWPSPYGDERNSASISGGFDHSYQTLWEAPLTADHLAPVAANGRIYLLTEQGMLRCLRTSDGTELWRFSLPDPDPFLIQSRSSNPFPMPTPPPVIRGGRVFVCRSGQTDGHVYALDATRGKVLWNYTSHGNANSRGPILSCPTAAHERLVMRTGGGLTALGLADGAERWNVPIDHPLTTLVMMSPPPAVTSDAVYLGATSGVAYAFDLKTGRRNWAYVTLGIQGKRAGTIFHTNLSPSLCPPVVGKGKVCVADGHGDVYGLDCKTGKKLWKATPGECIQLASNGHELVAATQKGLHRFDLTTGKSRGELPIHGGVWNLIVGDREALVSGAPSDPSGVSIIDLRTGHTVGKMPAMNARFGVCSDGQDLVLAGIARGIGKSSTTRALLRICRPSPSTSMASGVSRR